MSLRINAEKDLGIILEDDVGGFGWPITVTNPAGTSVALVGSSTDIMQGIDPDTGVMVTGRIASVALRLSSLTAAGLGIPVNISDKALKPWLIEFDDINGAPYIFKVSESRPDRALGLVVCVLELYKP